MALKELDDVIGDLRLILMMVLVKFQKVQERLEMSIFSKLKFSRFSLLHLKQLAGNFIYQGNPGLYQDCIEQWLLFV